MPILVLLAVLFSALLHAGWNAVLRHSQDRKLTVAWIGIASAVVSIPIALSLGFPSHSVGYVLGSSALHILYLYLLAKAYRLSELSFAYPIARGSSPMLVALGGLAFAAEKQTPAEWFGIALIAMGILAIGLDRKTWDAKGLMLALVIGLVIAVYTVMDALGARLSVSSAQYNTWEFSIYGAIVAIGEFARHGKKGVWGNPNAMRLGFLGGVTSVIAYSIVVWGMVHAPMGSVSAIRETSTLFAAAIGFFVLKEKFSSHKLIGSISVVTGAVLVGLAR